VVLRYLASIQSFKQYTAAAGATSAPKTNTEQLQCTVDKPYGDFVTVWYDTREPYVYNETPYDVFNEKLRQLEEIEDPEMEKELPASPDVSPPPQIPRL
jgi:hypothetical protein